MQSSLQGAEVAHAAMACSIQPHALRQGGRARRGCRRRWQHVRRTRCCHAPRRCAQAQRGNPRHRAPPRPSLRARGLQPPPQPRRDLGRAAHGRAQGRPQGAPPQEAHTAGSPRRDPVLSIWDAMVPGPSIAPALALGPAFGKHNFDGRT